MSTLSALSERYQFFRETGPSVSLWSSTKSQYFPSGVTAAYLPEISSSDTLTPSDSTSTGSREAYTLPLARPGVGSVQ